MSKKISVHLSTNSFGHVTHNFYGENISHALKIFYVTFKTTVLDLSFQAQDSRDSWDAG